MTDISPSGDGRSQQTAGVGRPQGQRRAPETDRPAAELRWIEPPASAATAEAAAHA